jgi:hypothetical protein
MEFRFVRVVPKYLNCSTLSKDLLSNFMLWFCPAFWSQDMTMYLVFSAFTSRPISLLATTKASGHYVMQMKTISTAHFKSRLLFSYLLLQRIKVCTNFNRLTDAVWFKVLRISAITEHTSTADRTGRGRLKHKHFFWTYPGRIAVVTSTILTGLSFFLSPSRNISG